MIEISSEFLRQQRDYIRMQLAQSSLKRLEKRVAHASRLIRSMDPQQGSDPVLIWDERNGEGQKILVLSGTKTIGRDPQADLVLDAPDVSRQHAEIRIVDKQVLIRDLNSMNGTIVNDRFITERFLASGDLIQIGDWEFLVLAE